MAPRKKHLFFSMLCVCLLAATATHAAKSELDNPWIRGIFTGKSPRPVVTSEPEAWQQASQLAENTDGAFVLVGGGESMQPLYQPGTILVLQSLPYTALQPGQTALYRNKANKIDAHVLVTKARDGWRAIGLNNRIDDMEPVCADNLVGVIIAAYQPTATSRRCDLAANIRSHEAPQH